MPQTLLMGQPSQPPLEAAWQALRGSLEWAREFGLVFVFCSNTGIKEALFSRADDLMRAQARPFDRPRAKTSLEELGPVADNPYYALLSLTLNSNRAGSNADLPLWLDLDDGPNELAWDYARLGFLYRLNERRAALAGAHNRAVVLVLPQDWTKRAAEAAPDLWTIRQPTVFVQAAYVAAEFHMDQSRETVSFAPLEEAPPLAAKDLPLAVRLWQQSVEILQDAIALVEPEQVPSVWDGAAASEAALEVGQTGLALSIAKQSVEFARLVLRQFGPTPQRLRDLSVSMNNLGNVAQALGQLHEAQSAYAEGMAVASDLVEAYGESVAGLETLAYNTLQWGRMAIALGDAVAGHTKLVAAQALYQRLALAMPHEARYQNALRSIAADAPGQVELKA